MDDSQVRRHRRYPVAWSVDIAASEWTEVLQLTTSNISCGGIFVESAHPAKAGARVQITLRLPDSSVMEVEGDVAHTVSATQARETGTQPGFGIQFDEQHAIDLQMLEATAASHTGGSANTYALEDRHMALPALVRDVASGRALPGFAGRLPARDELAEAVPLGTDDYELVEEPTGGSEPQNKGAAGPVFGVDFGTSYSSIAMVTPQGIKVLEDEENHPMFPSVVCYSPEGVITGWQARRLIATHRESTFLSPKRLLGRQYDDPNVQPYIGALPVPTQKGPDGQILAQIDGQPLAMAQVCAEIFRQLARVGKQATGIDVERIVVSVPVAFGQKEAAALKRAAELAGLQVVGMLQEPVAAAMAYGLGRAEGELITVYDFGGGTFDCTLLKISNERFKILATGGDDWLGGDDFDLAMANHAADIVWRQHEVDVRKRVVEWQRLLMLAERCKRRLSTEQKVEIRARQLTTTSTGPIDLQLRYDRDLFAALCGVLVQRSIELVDGCLATADVSPRELKAVLLTGGVSRTPLVRQMLQDHYQREIQLAVNPEQAVVMGNAIYARFIQLTNT